MAEEQKTEAPVFDIPKECKAGVVVNEGPDFRVEVQMVPVPEVRTYQNRSNPNPNPNPRSSLYSLQSPPTRPNKEILQISNSVIR